MQQIGLINYGSGNFSSVRNALIFLDFNIVEVKKPQQLKCVTHIILPGVGAFASTMRKLKKLNLIDALKEEVLIKKKPFLGICVGMQILASLGHEFEDYLGLDFIEGEVDKIDAESYKLPLPHMGWNELNLRKHSYLFHNMRDSPIFYFVHSYHFIPYDHNVITATAEYGSDLVTVVEKDNIYGVQFHPEKSQHDGIQLLKNFVNIDF